MDLEVGQQCALPSCKQLDFLPFEYIFVLRFLCLFALNLSRQMRCRLWTDVLRWTQATWSARLSKCCNEWTTDKCNSDRLPFMWTESRREDWNQCWWGRFETHWCWMVWYEQCSNFIQRSFSVKKDDPKLFAVGILVIFFSSFFTLFQSVRCRIVLWKSWLVSNVMIVIDNFVCAIAHLRSTIAFVCSNATTQLKPDKREAMWVFIIISISSCLSTQCTVTAIERKTSIDFGSHQRIGKKHS